MPAGLQIFNAAGQIILDITDRTATIAGTITRVGASAVWETITVPYPDGGTANELFVYIDSVNAGAWYDYQVRLGYPARNQFSFRVEKASANTVTNFHYGWS